MTHWLFMCACLVIINCGNCPTLCDLLNCSSPGLCPWIFQAGILELAAISSSRGISPTQGSNPLPLCLPPALQVILPIYSKLFNLYISRDSSSFFFFCSWFQFHTVMALGRKCFDRISVFLTLVETVVVTIWHVICPEECSMWLQKNVWMCVLLFDGVLYVYIY